MGTLAVYIIILAVLISELLHCGKKSKGKRGEDSVSSRLVRLKKKGKYNILNDLLIGVKKGGTSQIDHVVVGQAGIFVIETKNYRGQITGDSREYEWTQRLHGKENTFENPLKQNRGHIDALKGLLGSQFPELKYHSLVVFPSRNLLSVDDVRVISRKELERTVLSHTVKLLSEDEVEQITDIIRRANITSKRERKEHVRQICRRQKKWKRIHGW